MREEHIETLNGARLAADRFVARFPPDFAEKEKGEKTIRRSVRAHSSACWRPGTWPDVIARVHDSKTYSSKESDLAIECLGRLRDVGKAISDSGASMEKDTRRPRATMRIAPKL
jgi:hypothetical protein